MFGPTISTFVVFVLFGMFIRTVTGLNIDFCTILTGFQQDSNHFSETKNMHVTVLIMAAGPAKDDPENTKTGPKKRFH